MPELEDLLSKSYRIFLFDTLEHYEHVIEKLTEYLKIDPHNGTAYNNRGLAFFEIGKGKDATIHRCRAYACLEVNRLHDAIDSFSEAIRLDPDFAQTYIDRSEVYRRLGDDKRAEQDSDVARRLIGQVRSSPNET